MAAIKKGGGGGPLYQASPALAAIGSEWVPALRLAGPLFQVNPPGTRNQRGPLAARSGKRFDDEVEPGWGRRLLIEQRERWHNQPGKSSRLIGNN